MAKSYNSNSNNGLGFAYDFTVAKPFDTRAVVDSVADLKTLQYAYAGMVVAIKSTGALYICLNVTTAATAASGPIASADSDWKLIDATATDLSSVDNKIGTAFTTTAGDTLSDLTTTATTAPTNTLSVAALGSTETDGKNNALFDGATINNKYLPSYVDDIIDVTVTKDESGTISMTYTHDTSDGAHKAGSEVAKETGKIYVDVDGNQYRYSGSTFILISNKDDATNIVNLQKELTWKLVTYTEEVKEGNTDLSDTGSEW